MLESIGPAFNPYESMAQPDCALNALEFDEIPAITDTSTSTGGNDRAFAVIVARDKEVAGRATLMG